MRIQLPLLALLTACAQPPPPVAPRDFTLEADALLRGMGPSWTCRNDRDCQQGEARAVCTLGTCFGLLTTDERVTRALLVERLGAADVKVQVAATRTLLDMLGNENATNGQKIAAIDGLAAVLAKTPNDEVQTLLRLFAADKDETLAVTARLALGRLGDPSVRAGLLEDLTRGTELLRAEAARALQPALADVQVKQALAAALQDPSPVVQLAALRALAPLVSDLKGGRDPLVAGKLADLAARAPAFRYEVEELLAGGGK